MIDKLFSIGGFVITPFGPLLVLAFLAGYWQLRSGFKRLGIGDDEDASTVLFAAGLGGILGGKLYYAILYRDLAALVDRAGLVWYGAFIGGLLAMVLVLRSRRLLGWATFDAIVLSLAVGYGVGRIGCFLVGDDYGRPTDLPWGVVFKQGLPPTTVGYLEDYFGIVTPGVDPTAWVAVHPTQLYETAMALSIWLVGLAILRRRPAPGVIFSTVLALLAVERFLVEILRAKDDRFLGVFTIAQLISTVIFVVAVTLLVRRRGASPAGPAEPA
jgi:phosphatidylglycerol:prolipoprotein diacylglycerol transferase